MRVNDMVFAVFYQPVKFPKGDDVAEGINGASEFGNNDELSGLSRAGEQFAFAPAVDAAGQINVVFGHFIKPLDGKQCVFLRAADDHARDNVKYAERRLI